MLIDPADVAVMVGAVGCLLSMVVIGRCLSKDRCSYRHSTDVVP